VNRVLRAAGRFLWDFFVGDTPELFVGAVVVLGAAAGLAHGGARTAAIALVPALVIGLLIGSVLRGRTGGK
jgi:hypothetical protein